MWTVSAFVPASVQKPILGTLTATWTNGVEVFVFRGSVNLRRAETVNAYLTQAKRALALYLAASAVPTKGATTLSAWCVDRLNA